MADPTGAPSKVVQAHRFELLDRHGRVRAVIGEEPNNVNDGADIIGVWLYDTEANPRTYLSLDESGPSLVFDLEGNNALVLGVGDPGKLAAKTGAYAMASDGDGNPIAGIHVHEDGRVDLTFDERAA